jgi:CDP-diacylglycerol--glycerol-3-phosphate 3-phosphatidyltransferase
MNWANVITIGRILLIPLIVVLYHPRPGQPAVMAAFLYFVASSTDLLDGYIARRFDMVTTLGKLLDPIADKILVATGLFLLVEHQLLLAWPAILIVAREIAVSGLRAIAASDGVIIPAENLGKIKMVFQTLALTFLLYDNRHFQLHFSSMVLNFHWIGLLLFWISLVFTLLSGIQYFFWYAWISSRDQEP